MNGNGDDRLQPEHEEAKACMEEIKFCLQKHGCVLVSRDVYIDGNLAEHTFVVVKQPKIIQPAPQEKKAGLTRFLGFKR